jgi:hypothetical protein
MSQTDIAFHYTSHEAAAAIIRSHELRLTHLRFLNDAKEWLFAYDRVMEYIDRRAKTSRPVPQAISEEIASINHDGLSACVGCFSFQPDDASQWMRYASKGEGVAIGFRITKLIEALESAHDYRVAGAVQYSSEEIDAQISGAMQLLERDKVRLRTTYDPIARLAALVKHPSFESEREFRIIMLGVSYGRYEFAARSNTIMPYVRLPIALQQIPCGTSYPVVERRLGV